MGAVTLLLSGHREAWLLERFILIGESAPTPNMKVVGLSVAVKPQGCDSVLGMLWANGVHYVGSFGSGSHGMGTYGSVDACYANMGVDIQ